MHKRRPKRKKKLKKPKPRIPVPPPDFAHKSKKDYKRKKKVHWKKDWGTDEG